MEIQIVKRAMAFVGSPEAGAGGARRLSREEVVARLADGGSRDLSGADLRNLVTEFTCAYQAVRFGGRTGSAPQLSSLLQELEQQR